MSKSISLLDAINEQPELIKKEVSFIGYNDEEFTTEVHVKQITFKEFNTVRASITVNDKAKNDEDKIIINDALFRARCILFTICDADGNRYFKNEDHVLDANSTLIDSLWMAADSVNNFLGKLIPRSLTKKNYGLNSSLTESVEKPSKKQRKTSVTKKSEGGSTTDPNTEV